MHGVTNTLVYYKRHQPVLHSSGMPFYETGGTSSPSPCLRAAVVSCHLVPAVVITSHLTGIIQLTNPAEKWVFSAGSVKRVRSCKG